MNRIRSLTADPNNKTKGHTALLVIIGVVLLILTVLVIATLASVISQKNTDAAGETSTMATGSSLVDTINRKELMFHLEQLAAIANANNYTRALGTPGFEATVDYIEKQLRSKTNFYLFRQQFFVPVRVTRNPVLTSTMNGIDRNYTYEKDFSEVLLSRPANFLTSVRLTIVPNSGCNDDDWQRATPHPTTNSVALVIRDQNCSLIDKSILAQKYNISGLLVYDSAANATRLPSVIIDPDATYPAMVLSNELGRELVAAAENYPSSNPRIRMIIIPGNALSVNVSTENLCADTPTGDRTQTIVVGSHSDSVENGPGINDNGSGAMATLVMALNLAHLFQTSSYEKYPYRIRFCWWAAEERGMQGSYYHIEEANITTVEGNRLKDYVLMLNFDMLGSPNYYFGIYEPFSLPAIISSTTKNASNKISQLFRYWFDKEQLPWDNSSLGISSDHVPFLLAGIACGGVFSGDDTTKTLEQRNRYDRMLGHGHGGLAKVPFDPCYHMACDTIENINPFAYETLSKAAAYVLETSARITNLSRWLYVSSETTTQSIS